MAHLVFGLENIRKTGIMSLSNRKDDLLMKSSRNKELDKLKKENEELRRQNLKLTVENAFIKKLSALVQNKLSQPKQK